MSYDFTSYFISGYKLRGEGLRKFQSNWVKVFHKNPSHYDFSGRWDYAVADTTGKFTQVQQIIDNTSQSVSGYKSRRLKVRGQGDTLQLKVSSVTGQPFDIIGWAVLDTVKTTP